MRWLIREVMGSDLDNWSKLVERCFGEAWGRPAFDETIAKHNSRMRLACDEADELAGFLIGRRIAETVEIDLLGVAPERRREGCAAALLEDLIQSELALGAEEFRLELRESNLSALALYAGFGFVVVGTRSRYYPDGENATLLTRSSKARGSLERRTQPGTES